MFQLPNNSRLFRKLQPANEWSWQEMLLNNIGYALDLIIWQNANQGVKRSKQTRQPKKYLPDFMRKATQAKALNPDQVVGTIDDIKTTLSKPRH